MTTSPADDPHFYPGLEGVVAFETEIAEPDKEGGALRYRGVDIEDLVGQVSFGKVWGLLVDGELDPGLPPAEPLPAAGAHRRHPGRRAVRASPCSRRCGASSRCSTSTTTQARDDLARASVMALSFIAPVRARLGPPDGAAVARSTRRTPSPSGS